MSHSFQKYLHTVGQRIVEQVGTDPTSQIGAIQIIWDGIYQAGATSTSDAPPRPVSAQDYLQGIQEGYKVGHQDGREEGN